MPIKGSAALDLSSVVILNVKRNTQIMKRIVVFSILIACCLAAPAPNDSIEVKSELGAQPETVELTETKNADDPTLRVGLVGALLGITTPAPPADAVVVYVRPGGIFRRPTPTTTTTTTTSTTTTTTTAKPATK